MRVNLPLFVYGTLRKDCDSAGRRLLKHRARFMGYARLRGTLYDLGHYPGMVPRADANVWVRGEVYGLADDEPLLHELDRYEGCAPEDVRPHEFVRAKAQGYFECGTPMQVWVYVYNRPIEGRSIITSGDWVRR